MLPSGDERVAISNVGWIDKGSLHILRTADGGSTSVRLSDAAYLKLCWIDGERFLVQHGRGPGNEVDRLEVGVHSFAAPATPLASASLKQDKSSFAGDEGARQGATRWFVDYFRAGGSAGYRLLKIDPAARTIACQSLDWMNSDSYELDYQGAMDVFGIPSDGRLIVSVQRSSTLVLHDPDKQKQIGDIVLGKRGGNPRVSFLRTRRQLWADDDDTLVRVDSGSFKVRGQLGLQGARDGAQPFIGEFAFEHAERRCAVARPFSADVAIIDVRRFEAVGTVAVGGEPLQIAITDDGRVFTRDWHTGAVRAGHVPA